MDSRRILLTGLSTYWGGRLAQALERLPEVEAIVGIDRRPPKVELERTEYVQVSDSHSLIRRIVHAAEIDTVVDTRLVVDSIVTSSRRAHENNVIGTMNVLAGCDDPDTPVRKVIVKSSASFYGAEQDDPAYFTEDMRRRHAPRTPIERDVVEAEAIVADFARRNPATTVTVLRFANALGPCVRTSHTELLGLPAVPTILGFDPRYQFIHEDDIAGALEHAVHHNLPGVFNAAGDGVLVLSEVVDLLRKPMLPVLPPWGTGLAVSALARFGVRVPPEMRNQLRYGRALDNRRLKATGFRFRYTTRETVVKLREHQRVEPIVRPRGEPYRYEREVEEFLRRSSSVRRAGDARNGREQVAELQGAIATVEREAEREARTRRAGPRRSGSLDDLETAELLALLPPLESADLEAVRDHERAHQARAEVLEAIDALLLRAGSA